MLESVYSIIKRPRQKISSGCSFGDYYQPWQITRRDFIALGGAGAIGLIAILLTGGSLVSCAPHPTATTLPRRPTLIRGATEDEAIRINAELMGKLEKALQLNQNMSIVDVHAKLGLLPELTSMFQDPTHIGQYVSPKGVLMNFGIKANGEPLITPLSETDTSVVHYPKTERLASFSKPEFVKGPNKLILYGALPMSDQGIQSNVAMDFLGGYFDGVNKPFRTLHIIMADVGEAGSQTEVEINTPNDKKTKVPFSPTTLGKSASFPREVGGAMLPYTSDIIIHLPNIHRIAVKYGIGPKRMLEYALVNEIFDSSLVRPALDPNGKLPEHVGSLYAQMVLSDSKNPPVYAQKFNSTGPFVDKLADIMMRLAQ